MKFCHKSVCQGGEFRSCQLLWITFCNRDVLVRSCQLLWITYCNRDVLVSILIKKNHTFLIAHLADIRLKTSGRSNHKIDSAKMNHRQEQIGEIKTTDLLLLSSR